MNSIPTVFHICKLFNSKMVSTDFAIPKGSLILVTGVNGFIASHIVDQLLERGYRVRGTVRDASKNGWLQELFEKRHPTGSLELVSVPDGTKPEVYPEILKGLFPTLLTSP